MIKRQILSLLICLCLLFATMPMSGCAVNPGWVSTLDQVLVAAAPALINILNIVAIAKGQPVNAALEAKINTDAATIKSLASDFASASAAAAPTACAQLEAAISTYSADQAEVMSLAQVSDAATQQKIALLSALVAGTVSAILALIPSCAAPASAKAAFAAAPPIPLRDFVKSYNAALTKKTGNHAVDSYTAKHKVHVHSAAVRYLSLGYAQ